MYTKDNKIYVEWEDIKPTITEIQNIIKNEVKDCHIIAPYRGALTIGTILSNTMSCPLSILNYQRLDAKSKEVQMGINANITSDQCLVLVDDIVDEGITMHKCVEFLRKNFPNNKIVVYTVHGNSNLHPKEWGYTYLHDDDWIVYPWEVN